MLDVREEEVNEEVMEGVEMVADDDDDDDDVVAADTDKDVPKTPDGSAADEANVSASSADRSDAAADNGLRSQDSDANLSMQVKPSASSADLSVSAGTGGDGDDIPADGYGYTITREDGTVVSKPVIMVLDRSFVYFIYMWR